MNNSPFCNACRGQRVLVSERTLADLEAFLLVEAHLLLEVKNGGCQRNRDGEGLLLRAYLLST